MALFGTQNNLCLTLITLILIGILIYYLTKQNKDYNLYDSENITTDTATLIWTVQNEFCSIYSNKCY